MAPRSRSIAGILQQPSQLPPVSIGGLAQDGGASFDIIEKHAGIGESGRRLAHAGTVDGHAKQFRGEAPPTKLTT